MKRFSNVTTTQLARICGVSQGTVDRALHNRPGVNAETRKRILMVAREYGYTPGIAEKARFGKKSMLLGAVLFDLHNDYFSNLAMNLVEQAKKVGYSVIFLFSGKDIDSEKEAIDYFNFIGVDGIILFSVGSDDEDYLKYLVSTKRPIVTLGNKLPGIGHIGIDDERAMHDLTMAFSEAADGEITYFAPVLSKQLNANNVQLLRLNGFIDAAKKLGRSYRVVTDDEALDTNVSSIICSTGQYLLRALGQLGMTSSVPFAAFDNTPAVHYIGHSVLTVDYSTDQVAHECISYLLGRKYTEKIDYRIIST